MISHQPVAVRSASPYLATLRSAKLCDFGRRELRIRVYERVSSDSSRICRNAGHRYRLCRSNHMVGDPIKRKKGMKLDSLIP